MRRLHQQPFLTILSDQRRIRTVGTIADLLLQRHLFVKEFFFGLRRERNDLSFRIFYLRPVILPAFGTGQGVIRQLAASPCHVLFLLFSS